MPQIAFALARQFNVAPMRCRLHVPAAARGLRDPVFCRSLPRPWHSLIYRTRSEASIYRGNRQRFLRSLQADEVVHLWPDVDQSLYQQVKARGHVLMVDMVNTHTRYSRGVLEAEYDRLGWAMPSSYLNETEIEHEQERLDLADYIFSPSPLVTQSLLEQGVAPEKVLASSFGWWPQRFRRREQVSPHPALPPIDGPTFGFIGSLGVRKAVPRLLEWWAQAGIRGRLVLAGPIKCQHLSRQCASLLNRDDVIHLGHIQEVDRFYYGVDMIVFPSLEEGSPIVTYEAMAHGVPCVVSPMAGGGVIRHGKDGLVLDPDDADAWIHTMRSLAADPERRRALGAAAQQEAQRYTWERVGAQRRALLTEALRTRAAAKRATTSDMALAPS